MKLTFCFDNEDSVLLQTKEKAAKFTRVCSFMNYQKFGDKTYPHDIRCISNGSPFFEATITKLQSDNTPIDSQLFLPPSRE